MIRRTVLVDIDHVLSAAWRRDGLIGIVPWDEYHALSVDDEPVSDVVAMINALWDADWDIVAITARPEKWRKLTNDWLVKHQVQVDEILMRPDGDYHSAPEIKMTLIRARFPDPAATIAIIMDDREDVIDALQMLNVTLFLVKGRRP